MIKLKNILYILLSIFIWFFIINQSYATINLAITPIKYEIEWETGTTITKTAKIRNPSDQTVHIITWKSDFVPNWDNWMPKFIRKSEMVYPDQQLADWIKISTWSFDIAPHETKQINFQINIPDNATPGWHYWAVFFKRENSEVSSWNQVWINVDYWVLILLTVKWKIIIKADIKEPIINTWWGWAPILVKDNCPNWDKSPSYYDKTCKATNKDTSTWKINNNKNNTNKTWTWKSDNFDISFVIPIDNKWNTHIKPKWKIILKDDKWNIIKHVWKEIVTNKKWAIIWQKIVNYIPINDVQWVVIPWSSRNFKADWKWFPYRDYDKDWNPIIKYWTPQQYYTRQNIWENKVLMPWEKIKERTVNKNITADFQIKYKWEDWKDIEFNSAKEFPVSYKEKYIAINYYILCPLFLLLLIIILYIIIKISNKTKCKKCWKTIDKNMKVCPYCWAKQKTKKAKK